MPLRKSGSSESPAPRRHSARIAAVVASKPTTPSPVKKMPKRTSKRVSKDTSLTEDDVQLNGTEATTTEEPIEKKQKIDDQEEVRDQHIEKSNKSIDNDPREESASTDIMKDTKDAIDSGFEVVDKSEIPTSESEEVKAAISAQGEDGELLVNYVQVSSSELPPACDVSLGVQEATELAVAAAVSATAPASNGVQTSAGDVAKDDSMEPASKVADIDHAADKPAVDEALPTAAESQPDAVVAPSGETPISQ